MRLPVLSSAAVFWVAACTAPLLASSSSQISGSVIGDGGRPLGGAIVQVMQLDSAQSCTTTTLKDGTFSLSCDATGRHSIRASFSDLLPWEIQGVELGPGYEIHLNFLLLPETAVDSRTEQTSETDISGGRLPNPTLATWQGNPITLRLVAIVVAAASFVLGALTMVFLGRRFGLERRPLSAGEVGDMILNPPITAPGERVRPVAVAGARGASASVRYGAEEIAEALATRHYGLVTLSLVVAPALFAVSSLALGFAMLVGHELWLFYAMLLVPAGFVLTPVIIGVQALRDHRETTRAP